MKAIAAGTRRAEKGCVAVRVLVACELLLLDAVNEKLTIWEDA